MEYYSSGGPLPMKPDGAPVSTHALSTKTARRLAAVDRFLTFIRVFLVALIVVGLLAFIWQQFDADNAGISLEQKINSATPMGPHGQPEDVSPLAV